MISECKIIQAIIRALLWMVLGAKFFAERVNMKVNELQVFEIKINYFMLN